MAGLLGVSVLSHMSASMFPGNLGMEGSLKLNIPSVNSPLKPLPPSQDPWYAAPPGFEQAEPGSVLRLRPAPGNMTSVVQSATGVLHMLYRTTDTCGRPAWAVTTLLLPKKYYVSSSGQLALLSYQFAYDSANVDSSPSYSLFNALTELDSNLGISANIDLLDFSELLLNQGWIVNAPDYEGPTAALGAGIQAGHATLDAQRAVSNLRRMIGAREKLTVALWGYSGVASGGLADDIFAAFEHLNQSPLAGHIASLVLGVTAPYPGARAYALGRLRPETARGLRGRPDHDARGDAAVLLDARHVRLLPGREGGPVRAGEARGPRHPGRPDVLLQGRLRRVLSRRPDR